MKRRIVFSPGMAKCLNDLMSERMTLESSTNLSTFVDKVGEDFNIFQREAEKLLKKFNGVINKEKKEETFPDLKSKGDYNKEVDEYLDAEYSCTPLTLTVISEPPAIFIHLLKGIIKFKMKG